MTEQIKTVYFLLVKLYSHTSVYRSPKSHKLWGAPPAKILLTCV